MQSCAILRERERERDSSSGGKSDKKNRPNNEVQWGGQKR